jgi:DeoR family transcriptional regulator, catabolite repression regulator
MFTLKTDLTVDEVMIPYEKLAVVDDNAIFKDVISDIQDSGFGIACIVDDELSLLGVVTDGDIRRIILKHQRPFSSLLLESSIRFATKDPIKLDSGTNIMEALKMLQDKNIWDAPVLKNGKLIGLIHLHFVVGQMMEESH